MSEWKECKLGDLISITGGFSYKGEYIGTGDKFLLGMGCVSYSKTFLQSGARPYSGDCSDRFYAKPFDIVLATRQQSDNLPILGLPAIIPQSFLGEKVIVGTNLYKVDNYSEVDNKYLYWLMRSPNYINHIHSCSKGSTVRMITKDAVESFVFMCPQKEERDYISGLLWQIEDKIDLLNRQNQTLESMAEALFRHYFIDNAEPEWEEKSLFDCIELTGGGTPKTTINEYWNGSIKWLSGGDIANNHKGFILDAEKSISEIGLSNSSTKLLPKYATVISARGTVGKFCILSEPMTFSQSNYGILPKYKDCFFFTYLLVSYSVEELQSAAYGSVFDTITTNTFKGLSVLLPEKELICQFETMVTPYFSKIYNNQIQIKTLRTLLDMLLPKLMNKDVEVEYKHLK